MPAHVTILPSTDERDAPCGTMCWFRDIHWKFLITPMTLTVPLWWLGGCGVGASACWAVTPAATAIAAAAVDGGTETDGCCWVWCGYVRVCDSWWGDAGCEATAATAATTATEEEVEVGGLCLCMSV